jgi:hypothetical protein
MHFTASQQAEIAEMVRVGQIPPKPPYHQSYVWTAMVQEAKQQIAALPPEKTKPSEGIYRAQSRFQGFYHGKWYAIHEAGSDGLPICHIADLDWEETRALGEGWVTCGHCAIKVGKGGH